MRTGAGRRRIAAYLKIIGEETDNLSFGPEGVPLSAEAEQSYLAMQAQSHDHIQLPPKVNGEIIGSTSLNRKRNRMRHRAEFGISLNKAWWDCKRGDSVGGGRAHLCPGSWRGAGGSGGTRSSDISPHQRGVSKQKQSPRQTSWALCWRYLSSRAVSSQVLSAEASLTSVFGMGTGGPSP